ncbi:MAG: alkaline phosphatase family protein [Gemmataceae bacterium]
MPQYLRVALILSPLFVLLGAGIAFMAGQWESAPDDTLPPPGTNGGRVVICAVFDQFRGDYIERFGPAFGKDGFARIAQQGTTYTNVSLPYACSSTGPGHASISTGVSPAVHGIVENSWFDRKAQKSVYSSRIEGVSKKSTNTNSAKADSETLSPKRMLAPSVGDFLKQESKGANRVVSISLKDRAAVLLGGQSPDGMYCFDTLTGEFHTAPHYRDGLPSWAEQFNSTAVADRWHGQQWDRLVPLELANTLAGPDDAPGEGNRTADPTRVFPHQIHAGTEPGKPYYEGLERTPFGNDLVWEFAKAAIQGEQLGQRDVADLLMLSFSSNDLIGHLYGPDSHEVLDTTVRTDRLLAEMMQWLDATLGAGKWSLVVVSDHGVCPIPEVAVAKHPTAARVKAGAFVEGLDEALDGAFGKSGEGANRWLEADFRQTFPWVYLNERNITAQGHAIADIENYCCKWLMNRDHVQAAYSRQQIASQPALKLIREAFHPERCGNVYLLAQEYVLFDNPTGTGTNHGTPHQYDRSIILLATGAGVSGGVTVKEPTSSLTVTPILAHLLGLREPYAFTEKLPAIWK